MPHYLRMYDDKEFLYAYDLGDRPVICQIESVAGGEVTGERGKKSKKPVIKFVGKEKKLAINKTNGKTIAKLYGKNTDDWAGKWIIIYPTTTEFGGETVDCIRVRPEVPQASAPRTGGRNGSSSGGRQQGQGGRQQPGSQQQASSPKPDLTQAIGAEMDRMTAGGPDGPDEPDDDADDDQVDDGADDGGMSDEDKRAIEAAERQGAGQ